MPITTRNQEEAPAQSRSATGHRHARAASARAGRPGRHAGTDPLADEPPTRPRAREVAAAMPGDELRDEVLGLARRLASGTYELLVLVGELDARGTWAAWGALSCSAWLADTCDIEICTARTQVRVARALRAFPGLDAAMRDGDLSYAKARVLVPYLTDENVDALIGIAETTPAGRLGTAIAAWSNRHDDQETITRRQHDARSVSWRTEPDGMVVLTARLEPATAGAVCAVVDTHVTRTCAPAGASLAQQRADALVTAVTSTSPSVPGDNNSTVTAEVVVHVRAEGCALTDGTPLADHTVTALLPDAFVSLLLHDSQRQPIDASPRRRFPTRRQRRIIDERADECQHPGCHARTFLQYDHIQPYNQHGPTITANLQRLCGPHNRAKQREQAESTPLR